MKFSGGKKHTLKKTLVITILALALFFAPPTTPKAHAWAFVAQEQLRTVMDMIMKNIQGIIIGALKQMAVKMINEQVANLISGSSSQDSKIIGNYKDFLYTEPMENTQVYMNDYLSQMVSGRGSASSYQAMGPGGGFGSGAGGSYNTILIDIAKKATIEPVMEKVGYVGNPGDNLFNDGSLKNLMTFSEGPNSPWGAKQAALQEFSTRFMIEQSAAQMEGSVGNGVRSTKNGDTITTPGALIAENMANVMDLGNKVISGATTVPEVITGVVTQIITQAIETGIGKAAENIQREGGASNWINPDTQAASNNETSNWVNPDTGRPFGQ